jgi:hypothetical protein
MANTIRGRALPILGVFFLIVILSPKVPAQQCTVKPAAISLGETAHLQCDASPSTNIATARLKDRTVKMYKQPDGKWMGLMPVSITDVPGIYLVDFFAGNETQLESVKLTIRRTIFPTQNVNLTPQIEELKSSPEEIQTLTAFRNSVSDHKFWEEPLELPVPGCLLSPFGVKRLHNGKPTGEYHTGVDQRSPEGNAIHAVAGGTVRIGQPFTVLGGTVAIDHGQGLETMYLHMSKIAVQPGAHVNRGDVIGYVGATGRANGPHLHWVIYVNGVPVNPRQWVPLEPCGAPPKPLPAAKN